MASQERKKIKIDCATSGNNTIVAAVANHKIRVISYHMVAAGTVTAKWQSAAAGTDLTGAMSMAVAVPFTTPPLIEGHIETLSGELLNLSLGGAVQVSGHLVYSLIPA